MVAVSGKARVALVLILHGYGGCGGLGDGDGRAVPEDAVDRNPIAARDANAHAVADQDGVGQSHGAVGVIASVGDVHPTAIAPAIAGDGGVQQARRGAIDVQAAASGAGPIISDDGVGQCDGRVSQYQPAPRVGGVGHDDVPTERGVANHNQPASYPSGVRDDGVSAESGVTFSQIQPAAKVGDVGDDGVSAERNRIRGQKQPATSVGSITEHPVVADGGRGADDVHSAADITRTPPPAAAQPSRVAAGDAQPFDGGTDCLP